MTRRLAALLLALALCRPAYAQEMSGPSAGGASGGTFAVDQSNPGTTNNVNVGTSTPEGAVGDAAWSGSGNGSLIAVAKALYNAAIASLPAGSAIIGKVGIDQTTPGTTNGVSPLATENHIGETGGNAIVVTNAMTTSNNTVTTGKAIGGLQTLAGMARVSGTLGNSGTTGLIQNVVLTFKDAVGAGPLDVYFFNANPSGSTCTDNTTFALVAADFAKVIGIAHVTDFTAGNPIAVGQAQNLALAYGLSSATSVFACVVARASFAITGTTNADLIVAALRN